MRSVGAEGPLGVVGVPEGEEEERGGMEPTRLTNEAEAAEARDHEC